MTCPACGRAVAGRRPGCLYCGATLPAEAVAVDAGPPLPAGVPPKADGVVLIVDLTAADPAAVAGALGLSAYEAGQRVKRGGLQLHRIAPVHEGPGEAARLVERGLAVIEVPEAEARAAAAPIVATGGRLDGAHLRLQAGGGGVTLSPGDVLLVVRGPIAREYETAAETRRVRTATLEPGYRFHLHRSTDVRPLELDPEAFSFADRGAGAGSSLLQLAAWVEAAAAGAPTDDAFRRLPPVLAPAQHGVLDAAGALVRKPRSRGGGSGSEGSAILDNAAQFRFYSGWLAAAWRRRLTALAGPVLPFAG